MKDRGTAPLQVVFDHTAEIFASDSHGNFSFPLTHRGRHFLETATYDELRLVASIWHPSDKNAIDLDRAYVELRASFDPEEQHWAKISEIEPVVPPYNSGDTFDGWIVLPVLSAVTAYTLVGYGFAARTRLQVRCNGYFVA